MTRRDYEFMKPSNMPDWMKDFAESEALRKKEGNYIDHINEVLNPQSGPTSVEAMVSELRERVGLDMLTKEASVDIADKARVIKQFVSMANELDASGNHKAAKLVDERIKALAKEDKESKKESKKEDPEGMEEIVKSDEFKELTQWIDQLVESRGGKVTAVSVQAIIENEKGMQVSPEVEEYLQNKIQSVRQNMPLIQEVGGPFGTDIQEPDRQANNEMFNMPETDM